MTPDDTGHSKGIGKEYSNCIGKIDSVLGATLPRWLDLGYDIIITSDHGMDINHSHGGSKCDEMLSPFYILSKKDWKPISKDEKMNHINVAPLIIDRVVGNSDYRSYVQKLIDNNSHYKMKDVDCLK
jgi:predicted AlkP superfamily pyrophosphatase or phosphodiesterase